MFVVSCRLNRAICVVSTKKRYHTREKGHDTAVTIVTVGGAS